MEISLPTRLMRLLGNNGRLFNRRRSDNSTQENIVHLRKLTEKLTDNMCDNCPYKQRQEENAS